MGRFFLVVCLCVCVRMRVYVFVCVCIGEGVGVDTFPWWSAWAMRVGSKGPCKQEIGSKGPCWSHTLGQARNRE